VLCYFKRRFYCCYYIVIRFGLSDVSAMLETDVAPSVRLQIYVKTSLTLWLKDDDTDFYRHGIEDMG
jgi:hypothetical protein